MTARIIRGVKPTRIELLKLRKRELLARKGHDLLEEKRDAMTMQFLDMIRDYGKRRRTLVKKLSLAYKKLYDAQLRMGKKGIEEAILAIPEIRDIGVEERNIMGVKIPALCLHDPVRSPERHYGYINTSVALDEAADAFEDAFQWVLAVAEEETAIRRLAEEIETTKRKVNALERIFIPRLHATQKYIEMHLEELEREDLFRRKRMKVLLARKGD